MARMEWRPTLEVGHGQIDAEHRTLVDALNRLHDAVEEGRGQEEVLRVLSFLRDYTVTHFQSEESLMIAHRYPGLAAHVAAHARLVTRVSDLLAALRSGRTEVVEAVQAFLGAWLVEHIQVMDKEFGWYLRGRGLAS
ncbi:MAG: hemerythrin family protein [Geothrix sp.]|nr:hemerythrin family protein [Geothrix sp.]